MTIEIRIPKAGQTMEEGVLVEWLVDDGATVESGQTIYRLETDKVEMDVETPVSGVIRISAAAGETYSVGAVVATVED